MKAIIFADRNGNELLPLTERTCVALLPIAAKPLIEYTLEALLTAGIHEVILVISAFADQLEKHLGTGERWGLQIEYVLSRGQELPSEMLVRLGSQLTETEYLLLRADILRSAPIEPILAQAQLQPDKQFVVTIDGYAAGIGLLRRHSAQDTWQASDILLWNIETFYSSLEADTLQGESWEVIDVSGQLSLLDSLRAYYYVNLEVLAGHFTHLILPVYRINEKLQVGRRSSVPKHNIGLVGSYCRVHTKAKLHNTILCDDVIVDREATLRDTVVLPGTYIGERLDVQDAIVWGDILIRVDSGAVVRIVDSFLLADLGKENFGTLFANLYHRGLGLLALLLSLPLWPVALLLALLQNPWAPLCRVKLRGNLKTVDVQGALQARDFNTFEWATPVMLLRHLPKLFAVITGHVRMMGVSPQSPEQSDARIAPWEKVRDLAPVGLLGPVQLTEIHEAPVEEDLLVEAHYACTRHTGTDFLWLMRGLLACFNKRAWSSQRFPPEPPLCQTSSNVG
ncbi:MAG: hypothetical protein BWK79_12295 [Beggiatoa sp. IS2]|nr:MAG: hypothetical protein BWK79_12295 [Beggiatoa sp. IS2]